MSVSGVLTRGRGLAVVIIPKSLTWMVSPSCSSVLATVTLLSLGMEVPLPWVIRRRWMENLDSAAMRSYRSAVLPWM